MFCRMQKYNFFQNNFASSEKVRNFAPAFKARNMIC